MYLLFLANHFIVKRIGLCSDKFRICVAAERQMQPEAN